MNIIGPDSKFIGKFSDDCLDALNRMLIKEPNDRIAIAEILHHPWIMSHQKSKKLVFDWTKDSSSDEEEEVLKPNQK